MNERFLRRVEVVEQLNSKGLPMTKHQLAKLAVVGGGPAYHRWGNRVLYKQQDLDRWIEERLGRPMRSSSDPGDSESDEEASTPATAAE